MRIIYKLKFYRYLIYKIYKWAEKRNDGIPVANTLLVLTVVHYAQMALLFFFVFRQLLPGIIPVEYSKWYIVAVFLPLLVFHYFYFYDKELWKEFEDEFMGESESKRKRGNLLVVAYILGSIFLGGPIAILIGIISRL